MSDEKYSGFSDIDILGTGLVSNDSKIVQWLEDNNIQTLKDLFEKDDEFDFSKTIGDKNIKALVNFARFKYLKKDLCFNSNLTSTIQKSDVIISDVTSLKLFRMQGKNLGDTKPSSRDILITGIPMDEIIDCIKGDLADEFTLESIFLDEEMVNKILEYFCDKGDWVSHNRVLIVAYFIQKKKSESKEYQALNQKDIRDLKKKLEEYNKELDSLRPRVNYLEEHIVKIEALLRKDKLEKEKVKSFEKGKIFP